MAAQRSVYGSGGGRPTQPTSGGGGGVPTVNNNLRSRQTARILDVISEGEINGLINGAKSIFLDGTALQNADNSFNFQGISYQFKAGSADQDPLTGFVETEAEEEVGVKLPFGGNVTRTITDANATAVRVKIRIPQLYSQNPSTGRFGDSQVFIQIEVKANGGSFVLATLTNASNPAQIVGTTTSPYEVAYRVALPAGGAPWDIKVLRANAEENSSIHQNVAFWASYTVITDSKLKYDDTAIIGLEADSSQYGSNLPARGYEVEGLLVQIPSNYNPVTRVYTGIWNGLFQTDYTNNPAWVLYDLITNNRYGLGRFLDPAQVDKAGFYEIAQYCDELVSDGKGGTEPRFTFNGVIQTQEEAYDVLNAIASGFRGMIYWGSGAVQVAMDKPSDPVKLVTPANIIGGLFSYSGTGLKARHTVAKVSWNDPDDGYRASIAVVEDKDGISRYGINEVDVVAFGTTSRAQAIRYGRWILDSEKNETETVTYQAGLDHLDVAPGDIIAIADPDYAGARTGGRIITPGTTSIVIDDNVTLVSGETYEITITMPDGTLAERNLTNSPGTTNTLTWASALSATPLEGAMWMLTAGNIDPRMFRVLAVREQERNTYEVTALFHDPTKYARVESNIVLDPPNYSGYPTGAIQPPTDLSFFEYQYQGGVGILSAINISWTFSPDIRVTYYEIEYKPPGGFGFTALGTSVGNTITLENTEDGDYEFRVRGVEGPTLQKSVWLTSTYNNQGLAAPPADVTNFAIQIIGTNANLSWTKVADLDLDHYEIRFSSQLSGVTWNSSSILVASVSASATAFTVPAMVGTYLIKAVDTSGVFSLNATSIISTVASIQGLNAVATVTESPTFSGTKTQCVVIDNTLRLDAIDDVDDWANVDNVLNWDTGEDGVHTSGTYAFASTFDLGAVYTSRLTPNILAYGADLFNTVDLWPNVDDVLDWDGANVSSWDVVLEMRYTSDNPGGSPTWTAWGPLVIGDYTARAFQFRLQLYSFQAGVTPVVETLEVQIDMEDRIEGQDNITSNPAGTAITFSPAFKETPAIAVSVENMATGDYYEITGQSATGFTIRFFNAGGTGISRAFDWVARGYGVQS